METNISIDLKSLIKKKSLTLRKLSVITGISPQQLSTINRAKSKKIAFITIYKLLKWLACTPNDLFIITHTNGTEKGKIQSK